MNHARISLIVLALSTMGSTVLSAQNATTRAEDPQFVLAPGEHDLRTVITAAASYLGRNMLVAEDLQGEPKVTLQVGQKLDRDGCLAVVTQLAYLHGLVLVPVDAERGMWEFINVNGARRNEAVARAPLLTIEEVRKLRGTRIIVTSVIPVQHVRATAATQTLRPFFATGGTSTMNLGTAGSESAIVISGFVDQILSAAALIAAVDIPAKEKQPTPEERVQALEAKVASLEAKVHALEKGATKD